ncbi:hypothetical protein [Emticicia sp. C21]|uniref:hypothetical protein n=1 Tax=Emticicia sp. C21 TaxID=2302915 RepID=UPI000E34A45F|nr:hypothetical protein [Emticicia sp. C21]RFS14244.1 hypothetical protein D0T08_22150 [Emticicia sp. C21]
MKKTGILLLWLTSVACSSKSVKDNPILVEANQIHLEAEAIQEQIEPAIERIDSLKSLLLAKKTPRADSLGNHFTKLKADFEDWKKNFFDVPGFEHTHDNTHHHHDHAVAPELPADKMLEVQKEIKANIVRIKTELNMALEKEQKVLK